MLRVCCALRCARCDVCVLRLFAFSMRSESACLVLMGYPSYTYTAAARHHRQAPPGCVHKLSSCGHVGAGRGSGRGSGRALAGLAQVRGTHRYQSQLHCKPYSEGSHACGLHYALSIEFCAFRRGTVSTAALFLRAVATPRVTRRYPLSLGSAAVRRPAISGRSRERGVSSIGRDSARGVATRQPSGGRLPPPLSVAAQRRGLAPRGNTHDMFGNEGQGMAWHGRFMGARRRRAQAEQRRSGAASSLAD